MRDGKLTVAGALLFASDPSAMMPQARVLRYDGTRAETGKRLNITKERVFCGPLPRVIEGAYSLISGMLREFQFLASDGKFRTVPEYPEFAWFEGLVNAVTRLRLSRRLRARLGLRRPLGDRESGCAAQHRDARQHDDDALLA